MPEKKKIVIIGANDFQNQLILKAKSMGYETYVFAWTEGAVGEYTADHFYPISIVEKENILSICREINPDAVASIASDLAAITVNYLGNQLGLKGYNDEKCVRQSTNKYEMRKAFKRDGIPVPKFCSVSKPDELNIGEFTFPIIVKPTDRSGSRAITKVYRAEELPAAIEDAVSNSFEKKAMVEEFIEGNEYSCECISYEGKHYFLALTKKYTTGAPHFIETGHAEPSDIPEELTCKVVETVYKALDALGVRFGASHSEFKIDDKMNIRIIEIGARMGGDCIGSDLVYLSTGYDFKKMVIETANGMKPSLEKTGKKHVAAIRFIFTEKDIDMLKEIKDKYPENIYRISAIETVNSQKIVDSSTRHGYYIVIANTMDIMKRIMQL